jgi:hypothetical protein
MLVINKMLKLNIVMGTIAVKGWFNLGGSFTLVVWPLTGEA